MSTAASLLLLPGVTAGLKLAVTGAAGYLGAEIACLASAQGHEVRAVVKEGQPTAHLSACSELMVVEDLCDLAVAREQHVLELQVPVRDLPASRHSRALATAHRMLRDLA